jgi:signal transduction histidine kinase
LTTRLIEAQELQNKHLARELHDVMSQQLATIGMDIEHVARHTADSRDTLAGALRGVMQSVNELARDIHRMSRQLHPAILADLGLSAAIKSECLAFSEQYKMRVEFRSVGVPHRVAEDVAVCLYRVTQESLRNVGKHAGNATVHVTLDASPDHISLTVKDNGVGVDPEKVKRKRGLGLVSMEERVRIVGGSLSMTTVPGDGTQIEVKVPLRRRTGDE